MSTPTARKLQAYLNELAGLQPLTAATRQRAEFQQVLQQALPAPLAAGVEVGSVYGDVLFLLAENGAVAAKLKQLTPRLLSTFRKQRLEITGIHIEVQVHKSQAATLTRRTESRRLSGQSVAYLEDLATKLEDSPLKQAISKLIATQRSAPDAEDES